MRVVSFGVVFVTTLAAAEKCPLPPPASDFTMNNLNGLWYEIGKIQTAGGAFFEKDCVCTVLGYNTTGVTTANVQNICRKLSPNGVLSEADSKIVQKANGPLGDFFEYFDYNPDSAVSYTIAALDSSSMVEFDCIENGFGVINYCFHALSRTPTMDTESLEQLQALIDEYGLNPHNLEWQVTNQTSCW